MVHDGFERFPEAASSDFPREFVSTGLNLGREHSFLGCVECSLQLVFVEPAKTNLFLIVPPARDDSTNQVHETAAGWTRRSEIKQFAQAVFLSVEEVGGQNPRRPLSTERSFQVLQEIELLKACLKLL